MLNIAVLLVAAVPLAALRAYVVNKFWGWFVAPIFGVDAPGVLYVMGLVAMVGLLRTTMPEDDPESKVFEACIHSVVVSVLGLAAGYVIHIYA